MKTNFEKLTDFLNEKRIKLSQDSLCYLESLEDGEEWFIFDNGIRFDLDFDSGVMLRIFHEDNAIRFTTNASFKKFPDLDNYKIQIDILHELAKELEKISK